MIAFNIRGCSRSENIPENKQYLFLPKNVEKKAFGWQDAFRYEIGQKSDTNFFIVESRQPFLLVGVNGFEEFVSSQTCRFLCENLKMTAYFDARAEKAKGLEAVQATLLTPQSTSALKQHSGLYRNGAKRVFDIAVVIATLPAILPIILVLALLVMRDGGPAFYSQLRVGRNGRLYTMWKLRSMVFGADTILEAYLERDPAARAEWDSAQKLKADPRITRFGRLLRKSSMDELPQLWNVLVGDMSLVGPRPMMPDQQAIYPGKSYFSLRPGITGNWQVSQRNESTFADRAGFDDQYHRDLCFAEDTKLLLATVRVVLHATGH